MKNLINKKKYLKNQEGFTLIEIIAVIVILGIMAAVAVPKFFSMQDQAAEAVLQGALAEGAVRFNHAFASYILTEKRTPTDLNDLIPTTGDDYLTDLAGTAPGVSIGDFTLTWTPDTDDPNDVTVTVTSCTTIPTLPTDITKTTKTISDIDWYVAGG